MKEARTSVYVKLVNKMYTTRQVSEDVRMYLLKVMRGPIVRGKDVTADEIWQGYRI